MSSRLACKKPSKKIDIVVSCVAVYFVMMPFDSFPVFGMGSLLKMIAFFPLIAVFLVHKKTRLRINALTVSYVIYVIANLISIAYSVDFASSLFEIKRLLMNSVLIIAVGGFFTNYTKAEVDYLIKALTIGGVATVVVTLLFSDTSSTGRLTLAINGTMQDQNYINGYMYFAFAFFINKLVGEKKLIYAIPSLALVVFTLMTGSRGAAVAIIALGIMVFLCNLFFSGGMKLRVFLVATLLVLTIVIGFDYLMSLLPSEVAARFSSDFAANYKGTNRTVLWGHILEIYKESTTFRKIFGYGYGTVPKVNTFNNLVAHNLWLDHLISGGIIGLILLIYMQVVFIRNAWRQKNIVIFSAFIGFLAMCMTLSLTNYKPLWNCMMMVMIMQNARGKVDSHQPAKRTER